jgi:hypothetical protein
MFYETQLARAQPGDGEWKCLQSAMTPKKRHKVLDTPYIIMSILGNPLVPRHVCKQRGEVQPVLARGFWVEASTAKRTTSHVGLQRTAASQG